MLSACDGQLQRQCMFNKYRNYCLPGSQATARPVVAVYISFVDAAGLLAGCLPIRLSSLIILQIFYLQGLHSANFWPANWLVPGISYAHNDRIGVNQDELMINSYFATYEYIIVGYILLQTKRCICV